MTEKEIYENALNVYPYDIRGQYANDANDDKRKGYIKGYKDAIGQLKQNPLDSMQEEPASEALEAEIERIRKHHFINDDFDKAELDGRTISNIARHFAAWQKEQMMAKAFDFTQEHNIACILASECLRNHGWFSRERVFNNLFRHLACVDKLFEGKFCGKTKVIVIKED